VCVCPHATIRLSLADLNEIWY